MMPPNASQSPPLFVTDPARWNVSDGKQLTGEKAANLWFLSNHGINVPPWVAITTHAHEGFMAQFNGNLSDVLNDIDYTNPSSIAETGRVARAIIETAPVPEETLSQIENELGNFIDENIFYSVRSSAVGEDSQDLSFAGQLDSFLFVRGRKAIMESIKKCWASAYTDRALSYRHHAGLDSDDVRMGVIIQEMVDGDVSGVAFTINPETNSPDEIFISAAYGTGEGIVSGDVDADRFTTDKLTGSLKRSETVEKDEQVVFNWEEGKGTSKEPVPESRINEPCLDTDTIESISETCKTIETLYGFPQDIEWTFRNGRLHILQARPVTTVSQTEHIENNSVETIWDNSNIVESYSGVTTPLTFSFIRHAYYMVYLQFCRILRVPEPVIRREDSNLRNMLGLLNGQVYYNLKNWYRLVSHLPGYNYNKSFMEQMMGVSEQTAFDAGNTRQISPIRRYCVELPRLIMAGCSLGFQCLTMGPRTAAFMKRVDTYYEKYRRFDFHSVSAHELNDIYKELENEVLMYWKAPIVNDFMIMIVYGVLQKLIINWGLDDQGTLANDLLSGQGDVESTLPMKQLLSISEMIRNDSVIKKQFSSQSVAELLQTYINSDTSALTDTERQLKERIMTYIDDYGFRCMNELKLEEPSLKEKPDFIFMMLKNYVSASSKNPPADDTAIRKTAENHVHQHLKGTRILKIIPRLFLFNRVLSLAGKGVKFREYQRFARTKMFGLVRNIFNAIGRKFHALGLIEAPEDIFWLSREEIVGFIEGHTVSSALKGTIRLRKEEYEGYTEELDQRIITRGIVLRNPLEPDTRTETAIPEDGTMKGTSCCPGVVRGKVRVITSPSDDMSLNNEILVAGKTDPGWVPLYPAARGLLIERGSILSHSSIVAREMGLPAIVGITGITKQLKTGDEVEMDGRAGTVRILNRQ